MAHLVETMSFHGTTPWHGLGTVLESKLAALDALKLAGLDWTVELRPAYAILGDVGQPIARAHAVVRVNSDGSDRDALGCVGDRYTAIQNTALAEWCDTLSQASEGRAYVEALGALDGGRRVWILMRHNGDEGIKLSGDDSQLHKYLLCCSSHDGSLQMQMRLTAVRVVCNNTLSAALKDEDNVISIRHTSGAQARLDAAVKAIGKVDSYFDGFTKLADEMTRTRMTRDSFRSIVHALTPVRDESDVPTVTANKRDAMMALLDTTPGAQPDTAWGAWMALTDYADHHSSVRGVGNGDVAERRAQQQLYTASTFKQDALELICDATRGVWGQLELREIAHKTSGNADLLADIAAATKGE